MPVFLRTIRSRCQLDNTLHAFVVLASARRSCGVVHHFFFCRGGDDWNKKKEGNIQTPRSSLIFVALESFIFTVHTPVSPPVFSSLSELNGAKNVLASLRSLFLTCP